MGDYNNLLLKMFVLNRIWIGCAKTKDTHFNIDCDKIRIIDDDDDVVV